MRTFFFLITSTLIISNNLFSQQLDIPKTDSIKFSKSAVSKFQIKIYGGYGFAVGNTYNYFPDANIVVPDAYGAYAANPGLRLNAPNILQGNTVDSDIDYTLPTNTKMNIQENTKGLGTGLRVGAGIDYILNDFINVGINADYFISEIQRNTSRIDRYKADSVKTTLSDYKYTAKILNLSPNLTFKAISRNSFFIYNKLGLTISVVKKLTRVDNFKVTNSQGGTPLVLTKEYSTDLKIPLGFYASLGIQTKLKGRVRFFAELQYLNVIFNPTKRTITSYKINNEEKIDAVIPDLENRVTNFVSDYNNTNPSLSTTIPPKNVPSVRIPIANVSLLGGLVFRL